MDIQGISSGLKLGADGIWYSSESQVLSYPDEGNELCFAVEESSFWFQHRNNCIVSVANLFRPLDNGPIFDVGGGNGFVSLGLSAAGFDVVLVEPGQTGAANARRRGVRNVICATAETARLKPGSLSAIGTFDVIEHIKDDVSFLQSMRLLLKPGGLLYATVPAYPFLWSEEDVKAGHFRRYTLKGISETLKAAHFEIVFSTCFFRFLPPVIFLLRTLPYKAGLRKSKSTAATIARDHSMRGGLIAYAITGMMKREIANLNKKRPMTFGGSCLVVARRSAP